MSLPAEKLPAPAPNRGLSISGLWWTPAKIAYHNNKSWRTAEFPQYKYIPNVKESQSVAVSPVGTDGLCRFVAWDVDTGNRQDVQAILDALPAGCVPFVSASGKKGWHIWLFPDRPLPTRVCVAFAKAVLQKANVKAEHFPTSQRSRCLKWPGSLHPETREVEVFINPKDLAHEYDTQAVLEGLGGEMWRTPADVISAFAETQCKKTQKKKPASRCVQVRAGASRCVQPSNANHPEGVDLAAVPEIAFGLAALVGRRVNRIGQGFRCILPGHQERRPSAAFCYGNNGTIVYHDFHHEKHGTPEILTLGEVYAAIVTGEIRKLRPVDGSRWLCRLALRLGFRNQKAVVVEERLKSPFHLLHSLGLIGQPTGVMYSPVGCKGTQYGESYTGVRQPTSFIYSPVGCKATAPHGCKTEKVKASGESVIERVWQVFCEEAMLSAMAGFDEVKLSKQFLAARAGVPADLANRAINVLAVLGVVEKVPGSGGMKGDRFRLCEPNAEETKRRFGVLFPDGKVDLRAFKRSLVAARLGEEIAATVFRRGAETVSKGVFGCRRQAVH